MNRRIKRIELRLTEAEAEFIREKSKDYRSVSQYIRDAVAEFSGICLRMTHDRM